MTTKQMTEAEQWATKLEAATKSDFTSLWEAMKRASVVNTLLDFHTKGDHGLAPWCFLFADGSTLILVNHGKKGIEMIAKNDLADKRADEPGFDREQWLADLRELKKGVQ